jgi:hypothetical protein
MVAPRNTLVLLHASIPKVESGKVELGRVLVDGSCMEIDSCEDCSYRISNINEAGIFQPVGSRLGMLRPVRLAHQPKVPELNNEKTVRRFRLDEAATIRFQT